MTHNDAGEAAEGESLSASFEQHLKVWEGRAAEALAGTGSEGLAIFAGELLCPERDDLPYPFRPEPWLKAWVPGAAEPGCWLALVPGRRPRLVFLQEAGFWHAPAPDPDGFWVAGFEIVYARSSAEARRQIGPVEHLAGLGPIPGGSAFASVNDPAILRRLDFRRAVKTDYEIACIAQANDRAAAGHVALRDAVGGCPSEFDLQQIYCRTTGQTEAELPYPSIIALNEHASILHYQRRDRSPPTNLYSCLVDAGAECNGYAADITRTWVGANDAASGTFAALCDAMDALHADLCAQLAPGLDFVELNERAHRQLAQLLAQSALVKCSAEEAHARNITHSFLPHGLGHLLGLQVHDRGGRQTDPEGTERAAPHGHPFLRLTRRLEAGFVVTIEPGLYFIPALLAALAARPEGRLVNWPAVERLLPYGGIRIEDDVLVTAEGAINLTRNALTRADPVKTVTLVE